MIDSLPDEAQIGHYVDSSAGLAVSVNIVCTCAAHRGPPRSVNDSAVPAPADDGVQDDQGQHGGAVAAVENRKDQRERND